MNLQQLKDRILNSCNTLESAGIDLSSLDIDFKLIQTDNRNFYSEITDISYALSGEDKGKVKIRIE